MTEERHPELVTPQIPPLASGVVHLWVLSLNRSPQEREYYFSLLSQDEKTRAEKFYFETARSQYIIGRGLLRTLLGEYLHTDPDDIEFTYEVHGKPALKEGFSQLPMQFNVSHSEDVEIVAVGTCHRVGVDVEWVRSLADMDDLARQFFTQREGTLVESLSGNEKLEVFYRIWTCKEAYLKASGEGLLLPLDQVEVRFESDGVAQLSTHDGQEMPDWQIRLFSPRKGYQGAVCVSGTDTDLTIQIADWN